MVNAWLASMGLTVVLGAYTVFADQKPGISRTLVVALGFAMVAVILTVAMHIDVWTITDATP